MITKNGNDNRVDLHSLLLLTTLYADRDMTVYSPQTCILSLAELDIFSSRKDRQLHGGRHDEWCIMGEITRPDSDHADRGFPAMCIKPCEGHVKVPGFGGNRISVPVNMIDIAPQCWANYGITLAQVSPTFVRAFV